MCWSCKPFLAIEFDSHGHDPKNDYLKERLCDRFGLPLVRIGMPHIFMENHGHDPYETFDPTFFSSVAGKYGQFPFYYAARWRNRLVRPFKDNAHLFGEELRDQYKMGMLQFGGSEGAWARGGEFRAICGQDVGGDASVVGISALAFHVFGMDGD